MSYDGYLLKIGDYKVPENKYIKSDTYKPYVIMQDIGDWTDAHGKLHRNVVDVKALKVEFSTPPMTNTEFETFMSNIRDNYWTKRNVKRTSKRMYRNVIITLNSGAIWQILRHRYTTWKVTSYCTTQSVVNDPPKIVHCSTDGKVHTLKILSERTMCESCEAVMKEFCEQYPNVKVEVVSQKKKRQRKIKMRIRFLKRT